MSRENELYELANLACDGALAPEQRDLLETLLRDNPENRALYLRYVSLHAVLAWRYRTGSELLDSSSSLTSTSTPTCEAPASELRRSGSARGENAPNSRQMNWIVPSARWGYVCAVTASLLFAGGIWSRRWVDPSTAEVSLNGAAPAIATLRESTGAVWTADGRPIDVGARIAANQLRIDGGEAEFVFDSGARVILAGPARLALESPLSVYLEQGKIAAHMPPSAIGFTVRTPTSTFVDQGTEFGVVAEANGATEVHVFQGQVDLRYSDRGANDELDRTLALVDRQARRIETKGNAGEDVSFSRSRFGNMALRVAEPMEWKISDGGNGHFYQLVVEDKPITWHEAARLSMGSFHRGRRGHLLTVTSRPEDQFVVQRLLMETSLRGAWIGMTDVLREGHFRWVTGEPFEFTSWAQSPQKQPDNFREAVWHGGEDYGMYADYTGSKQWAWNDLSVDSIHEKVTAYIVEYEPQIDTIRNGTMCFDPIEWSRTEGGNGHFYQLVLALEPTHWEAIRDQARAATYRGVDGDLLSLNDREEFDFTCQHLVRVCGIPEVMIGLSGSLRTNDLRWCDGLPVAGIDVKLPHLPANEVYGLLRWHFDHWEIQTRESSGYPDDWFGYVIEYAVEPIAKPNDASQSAHRSRQATEGETVDASFTN